MIGRSREGAWIEIAPLIVTKPNLKVAPARERGLKCPMPMYGIPGMSRSREGAWIEIALSANYNLGEGVVAPARERGLKFSLILLVYTIPSRSREGAWIEM